MAQPRFRVFAHPAIAKPPKEVALTLKYKQAQEHLLRRLGQAAVLHWEEFPKALQNVVIDQAAIVGDRDDADHSAEALELFIARARRAL